MSSAGEISGSKKSGRYVRDDLDFFIEPAWCVDLLLENEPFYGCAWDPACGNGTIVRRAQDCGIDALGSDIANRGFGASGWDFTDGPPHMINPDNIICNPPFKLAEAFIHRALFLARHKVAMLVQAKFLYSQARHALFTEHPAARIYHLSSRPSMPPGDLLLAGKVKATGGKLDYCWLVWAKDHRGPTQAHWLLREKNGQKEEEKKSVDHGGAQGGVEAARHAATA